jgi:type II secretory pathway pseudopilin PulG
MTSPGASGPGAPCANESGFSLIEALIALLIISAMISALVGTIIEHAHARQMVRLRREALMVAQSALDRAAGGQTDDFGQWQDLSWQIDRQPYGESEAFAQIRLQQLTVTVRDADRHQLVRLETVGIVP